MTLNFDRGCLRSRKPLRHSPLNISASGMGV